MSRLTVIYIITFLFGVYCSARISTDSITTTLDLPNSVITSDKPDKITEERTAPEAVNPPLGTEKTFGENGLIRLVDKLRYFGGGTRGADTDIVSPKSVNIHPSGTKFYVNSLEGCKTVVYSLPELEKIAVVNHRFDKSHSSLWAPPSGLFKFRHYSNNLNTFTGKPVESTFSHDGRYLWVPYYRRSFDLNAQDPSALAIIDTSADTIVRLMEAGVLPKMIALSPTGKIMAVTHWGDNTVGLIDVSSAAPEDWKYVANVVVGKQLFHNYSLTEPVNRDKDTGEALRGTTFTPDGRYLLVGCMGGGGGIAVIDVEKMEYLGKLTGLMPNIRHLLIHGDWLYASINIAGYVQRVPVRNVEEAIAGRGDARTMSVKGCQSVKISPGARTIVLSPRGDYIFAACNFGSKICVVDSTMSLLAEISVDSYPVGLDISPDGRWLISTSQGRNRQGGNCVDVFCLSGVYPIENDSATAEIAANDSDLECAETVKPLEQGSSSILIWIGLSLCLAALILYLILLRFDKKN